MGSPLDGAIGTSVTLVGGALDWPINWVLEGAGICIHGPRYYGGPMNGKPHGWGCIQVYYIQPSDGCHCHWADMPSVQVGENRIQSKLFSEIG